MRLRHYWRNGLSDGRPQDHNRRCHGYSHDNLDMVCAAVPAHFGFHYGSLPKHRADRCAGCEVVQQVVQQVDHGAEEAARHGIARSPEWPKVEKAHREAHPACACCGRTDAVQVHHIYPFHYCVALGRPDLELDQRNLITLCETNHETETEDHHLLLGHLDDWKNGNLYVAEACNTWKNATKAAIMADPSWLKDKSDYRLVPLDKMTDEDKQTFQEEMANEYPTEVADSGDPGA